MLVTALVFNVILCGATIAAEIPTTAAGSVQIQCQIDFDSIAMLMENREDVLAEKRLREILQSEKSMDCMANAKFLLGCIFIDREYSDSAIKYLEPALRMKPELGGIEYAVAGKYLNKARSVFLLKNGTAQTRRIILERAGTWHSVALDPFGWIVFGLILLSSICVMSHYGKVARDWGYGYEKGKKRVFRMMRGRGLLQRDFGPLSFDIPAHQSTARIGEYRGALHWHRDVIEKGLSLFLSIAFAFFLAKACGYLYAYVSGEGWKLCLLPLDISFAISIVGFSLIIDGMILVASMTDAPGISRALDSLIVLIVGAAVMLIEVRPGDDSLLKFDIGGKNPWLLPLLAGAVAILFLIRDYISRSDKSDGSGDEGLSLFRPRRGK
jgi:hypothetical protein